MKYANLHEAIIHLLPNENTNELLKIADEIIKTKKQLDEEYGSNYERHLINQLEHLLHLPVDETAAYTRYYSYLNRILLFGESELFLPIGDPHKEEPDYDSILIPILSTKRLLLSIYPMFAIEK